MLFNDMTTAYGGTSSSVSEAYVLHFQQQLLQYLLVVNINCGKARIETLGGRSTLRTRARDMNSQILQGTSFPVTIRNRALRFVVMVPVSSGR
jgi:hypothetical protein